MIPNINNFKYLLLIRVDIFYVAEFGLIYFWRPIYYSSELYGIIQVNLDLKGEDQDS